jgi:hypothetical protein
MIMFPYFVWVPFTIGIALLSAYGTVQLNKYPTSMWFWFLWLPLTLWPFIAKTSTTLMFDSILYDCLVAGSWLVGLVVFGATQGFTLVNYIGVALAVIGLLLMKV